jgi:hypothetical protein
VCDPWPNDRNNELAQALADLNQCRIELAECQVSQCAPTHNNEKGPRCSDGIDNDCDGFIDQADTDCQK